MKNELSKRDEELVQFKRRVKSTKMVEMEAELTLYKQETGRLRQIIEDILDRSKQFKSVVLPHKQSFCKSTVHSQSDAASQHIDLQDNSLV